MHSTTRRMYVEPYSTNNVHRPNISSTSTWFHAFKEFLHRIYMQFLLMTALYVMEPWEQILVLSVFFLVISLVSYSALVYIPFHFQHVLQWITSNPSNISTQ